MSNLRFSRKAGEKFSLFIKGVRVVVTILQPDRNRVPVGVQAPSECIVLREELLTAETLAACLAGTYCHPTTAMARSLESTEALRGTESPGRLETLATQTPAGEPAPVACE